MRHVDSSIGSSTYNLAKYVAAQSREHVGNSFVRDYSREFISQITVFRLQEPDFLLASTLSHFFERLLFTILWPDFGAVVNVSIRSTYFTYIVNILNIRMDSYEITIMTSGG